MVENDDSAAQMIRCSLDGTKSAEKTLEGEDTFAYGRATDREFKSGYKQPEFKQSVDGDDDLSLSSTHKRESDAGCTIKVRQGLKRLAGSSYVQSAVQLTVGMFVISLFILIGELKYYYNACLAVTLFVVNSVMMVQDNHVGSKWTASSFLIGSALLSLTISGIMLTISKTLVVYKGPYPARPYRPEAGMLKPQRLGSANFSNFGIADGQNGAYIAVSCVLAVLSLAVVSINRVAQKPPFLWALGLVSSMLTGIVFIDGLYVPTAAILWNVNIKYLLASICLAATIASASALVVMPSFASSEAREKLCEAMKGTSNSLHRSIDTLVAARAQNCKIPRTKSELALDELIHPDMEVSDDAFLEILQMWTKPMPRPLKKVSSRRKLPDLEAETPTPPVGPPPVASLRPLLARARACAVSSQAEPLFLQPKPLQFGPFMGLVSAVETLLTKASAFEALLADPDTHVVRLAHIADDYHDCMPVLLATLQKVAEQCQITAQALENPKAPLKEPLLRSEEWTCLAQEVGEAVTDQLKSFWSGLRAKKIQYIARVNDVRSLMLLISITYGVLDSITAIEKAAEVVRTFPDKAPQPASQQQGDIESGGDAKGGSEDPATQPEDQPSTHPTTSAGYQLPPWVVYWFSWLIYLAPLAAMLPALQNIGNVLVKQLPATLTSRKKLLEAVNSKWVQAWFKYWMAMSIMLVLIIVMGYKFPNQARLPPPIYGFQAASIALSEKVEATISKIVIWLGSTAIGATLAYAVMLRPALADDPYAIMAILCVYTLVVGVASQTQLRVATTYALMTFAGLVLCQYSAWCAEGNACERTHLRTYASRVLSVSFGAMWAAAVTNLIMPWYHSSWALQTLGEAYVSTAAALKKSYVQFFHEGHKAAVRHESVHGPYQVGRQAHDTGAQTKDADEDPEHSELVYPDEEEHLQAFIQGNIEARLTEVQTSLAKDTTFWKDGLLSTPKLLFQVLEAMSTELDRLSMLQMALAQPHVTGKFNGWAYRLLLEEMHPKFMDVLDKLEAVAQAVGQYMSGCRHNTHTCLNIDGLCSELDTARVEARNQLLKQRKALYHAVLHASDEEVPYVMHVDDSIRFMAYLGGFTKCVNNAESVARTVAQDCHWKFESEWLK